ncbi:leucyl/phenylalanyl-tRNA--protein transferase [Actinomycetota bacterium Odt1-20B]
MIRTQDRAESPWASLDVGAGPAARPVALGGDLEPHTLLTAYRHGLYPFPTDTVEATIVNELTYEADVEAGRVHVVPGDDPFTVTWWSPDPRPVIRVTEARIQRSLRRQLRHRTDWTTTADTCFDEVVRRCRAGRAQRWLTDGLLHGLSRLHAQGHAHSVEVWDRDELIGGVFGVRVGAVFSADSQFTLRSGAGKTAVADLTRRFAEAGGAAVDVQRESEHARLLGARPVPRSHYLALLSVPTDERPLDTRRLPADRLAQ